eukprot:TRINITY_DN5556_c0_g1_i2.p2 TRINITY_DN5556_c0_g1~~TRINITY_DN5556_c0_g1_i2.p2  ORF type:complete len:305 (-),score=-7.15 TRINITY_DN5556_c0_g1_i2:542-1456(-)
MHVYITQGRGIYRKKKRKDVVKREGQMLHMFYEKLSFVLFDFVVGQGRLDSFYFQLGCLSNRLRFVFYQQVQNKVMMSAFIIMHCVLDLFFDDENNYFDMCYTSLLLLLYFYLPLFCTLPHACIFQCQCAMYCWYQLMDNQFQHSMLQKQSLVFCVGCYIGRVDTSCYQILLQLLSDHIIYVCTFLLELVVQENLLQINNFFLKLQFFMYQECIILLMLLCIHVNTLDAQKFLAFVGVLNGFTFAGSFFICQVNPQKYDRCTNLITVPNIFRYVFWLKQLQEVASNYHLIYLVLPEKMYPHIYY